MNARAVLALALILCGEVPLLAQTPGSFLDRLDAERIEQSGTVISIIFDDSGSMAGAKITQARAAFHEWIAKVPASYRLGLVALNAGALVPLGRDNRPALLAAVDRIHAGGGTPLVTNIQSALAEIERRRGVVGPYERHILLVFTDGEDTTSDGNEGVARELNRARAKGVETVGIGYHGEGNYMRGAATRYYEAGNLAELQQSLAKVDVEIGDTADILIDDRTRAAMQSVATPLLASAKTADSASPPASSTAPRKRGNWLPCIFFVLVFWVMFRAMSRAMKRRKSR